MSVTMPLDERKHLPGRGQIQRDFFLACLPAELLARLGVLLMVAPGVCEGVATAPLPVF